MHTRENTWVRMHMPGAVSGVRFIHGKMLFPLLRAEVLRGGRDTGGRGGGAVPSAGKSAAFSHGDFRLGESGAGVFPWADVWCVGLLPSSMHPPASRPEPRRVC